MRRAWFLVSFCAAAGLVSTTLFAKEYVASLSANQENPANSSTATGLADLSLVGDNLTVNVTWSGLTGNATAAHIHCCIVPPTNTGVAIPFVGFPSASSGSYTHTFNLADSTVYQGSFLALYPNAAAAEADIISSLNHNLVFPKLGTLKGAYVNIHTSQNPGGEVRGFPTPEPGTLVLAVLGVAGLGVVARKRR
jgi:CHRD domain-containing protein/PEP-CTERM motif-containing protein